MNKIKIIAEIGINHNGDVNLAKKLIDIAKKSGADVVKFQKRSIDKVYPKEVLDAPRESPWGKTNEDQKRGLEFGLKEYEIIDNYCKSIDIDWFASAWDLESLEFLDKFNCKYNKIASAMIVDKVFLDEVAKKNKHTFISTGMATYEDIKFAVETFKKNKTSFELMHCVSLYPCPIEYTNLQTIVELQNEFKCNVGYSGHESGIAISIAAAAFNITSLERHITIDRSMYGSDQAASLEKRGFNELIGSVRKVEAAIGENKLGYIYDEEKEVAKKLRVHIKIN